MILRERNKNESKRLSEDDLAELHHRIMVVYGWIPFEEFKSLPLPTLLSLNKFVCEEYLKREEFRIRMLNFAGVKNPK